jgi:hypothetical protein
MRKMRKTLVIPVIAILIALALPVTGSADPILSITPAFQSGNIGDIFTVNLILSGLTAGQEVGGFDVDISFNSSILAPLAITLGVGLGTGLDQFTVANSFAGGVADIAQFSFLDELSLQTLQGGSFLLATLTFQGIANGLSNLTITQAIFSDGNFNSQPLPVSLVNGAIQVGSATSLPAPGTLLLLGAGMVVLGLQRRWRK